MNSSNNFWDHTQAIRKKGQASLPGATSFMLLEKPTPCSRRGCAVRGFRYHRGRPLRSSFGELRLVQKKLIEIAEDQAMGKLAAPVGSLK